jgi:pyruvate-ferredoxin/flavodoxin oxidoreductase
MMAMSYGNVYVAQVAMGADKDQTLRAIAEAEAWPGPSLVIAYAACINHGLKAGMRCSQREAKRAVEAGYWHLWRYHPQREAEGKTPFMLDSEEPEESFRDFLLGEVRYASLHKTTPHLADALLAEPRRMRAPALPSIGGWPVRSRPARRPLVLLLHDLKQRIQQAGKARV